MLSLMSVSGGGVCINNPFLLLPVAARAAGLGLVMNWVQAQGKEIGLPGGVASFLKLSDPKHDWVCRTEAYEGDDKSQHYFSVGMKRRAWSSPISPVRAPTF